MSIKFRWIFVAISFLILLSLFIPTFKFLRKAKALQANVVTDGLSTFSIGAIAFLFTGYQVDLMVEINTMSNALVYSYGMTFSFLGLALSFLLSQNIFAFTDDRLENVRIKDCLVCPLVEPETIFNRNKVD